VRWFFGIDRHWFQTEPGVTPPPFPEGLRDEDFTRTWELLAEHDITLIITLYMKEWNWWGDGYPSSPELKTGAQWAIHSVDWTRSSAWFRDWNDYAFIVSELQTFFVETHGLKVIWDGWAATRDCLASSIPCPARAPRVECSWMTKSVRAHGQKKWRRLGEGDLLSLHIYRGSPEEIVEGVEETLAQWDAYPQTIGLPFYLSEATDGSKGSSGEVEWNDEMRTFHTETIALLIDAYGERFRGLIDHSMADTNPYTSDDGTFWPE
jgi:hypothetical protein